MLNLSEAKGIGWASWPLSQFCVINFPHTAVQRKLIGCRLVDLALDVVVVKCSIEMAKNCF